MKHLKITSIILSVSMCMSMIAAPVSVFADETPTETENIETTKETEPKETEKKKAEETKAPKETEKAVETSKEESETEASSKPEPSETVKETESSEPSETEPKPAEPSENSETEETKPSEPEESKPSESETQEMDESKPSETEETEPAVPEESVPSESDSKARKDGFIASGKCGSNMTWTIDDNGTLTISGTGRIKFNTGSVYPEWHEHSSSIKSVVFDCSPAGIPGYSFYDCANLTSIEIPKSVSYIDSNAFCNCTSLKQIVLPENVKRLYSGVFSGSGLSSVDLSAITYIETELFKNCKSLKTVTLSGDLSYVGYYAFDGCTALTDVYFNGTEDDWKHVSFESNNKPLEDAKKHYSDPATSGKCGDNLKWTWDGSTGTLSISGTGEMYGFSEEYGGYCTTPWRYYTNDIKKVEISGKITNISSFAFCYCSNLSEINIPDGVEMIGDKSFYECTSLKSISLPAGLKEIGKSAFANCSALTEVKTGKGLEYIGNNAFSMCISLKSFSVPYGVAFLSPNAFMGCKSLTSITLPDSLVTIQSFALCGLESLESVRIPASVKTIETNAFNNCPKLMDVYYDSSADDWNNIKIYSGNDGIKGAVIHFAETQTSGKCGDNATWSYDGSGTLTISGSGDMYDFYNIPSYGGEQYFAPWSKFKNEITKVVISDDVTSVGKGAFYECEAIVSVKLPAELVSIGDCAFEFCKKIESISVPSKVISIGLSAFAGCIGLKSINLPSGLTKISDWAFESCESLNNVVIPENVTSVGHGAFNCCSSLESINIPVKVTKIGAHAFEECKSLKEITIPGSVTKIGKYAFAGCTGLKTVTLNDGLKTLDKRAFNKCTSLESITIPGTITRLSLSVFKDCTGLKTVVIKDGIKRISCYTFDGCTMLSSVTIPDSVTEIGDSAFNGCALLSEITLPDSVKVIERYAFGLCNSLKSIVIPEGVTKIPAYAFMNCYGMESITIPSSVTEIGDGAFYGCAKLKDVYYGSIEQQWKNIMVGNNNQSLANASVHYNKPVYKVTVNSGASNMASASEGDTVTITADMAPADKKFDKWVVNEGDVTLVNLTSSETTFTMPAKPVTVTATYKDLYVASGRITNDIRWSLDDKGRLVILGIGAMPDWADKSELPWSAYLDSIKEVTVFTGITNIGDHAFAGCKNITRIEIPMSVVKIGVGVLEDSSALKNIYYNGSKDDWDKIVIDASNTMIKYTNISLNDGTFIHAEKRDNTLKVTGGKTAKVKYKKLRKKAQSVARGKLLTVSYPQGKLTYRITSVSKKKYKKYFKINASTGTVTVKKKLKKGTYTIKVTVTAAGNDQYKSVTKSSSFKIKVK